MSHLVKEGWILPPTELEITAYASVAIVTACILDWMFCVEEEVEILGRTGLNLPVATYFISRLASVLYCIFQCLTIIGMVPPTLFGTAKFALWWITGSATTLLFFFRIRAVYNHSKPVRIFFSVLWAVVVLTPIAIIFDPNVGCASSNDKSCNPWNPYSLPSTLSVFCYDTLVFLGVSRQIYYDSIVIPTKPFRFRWFAMSCINGEGLHKVSKSLMQSGQLYYGATIGVQLANTITVFFGIPYATLIVLAYVALSSTVACRVFRMVRLCKTEPDQLNTADIDGILRAASANGGDSPYGLGTIRTFV